MHRENDAPTPGVDDTPYIHFALDQLTRDEEVRGSRRYPGVAPGIDGDYPYDAAQEAHWPSPLQSHRQHQYQEVAQEEGQLHQGEDLGVAPLRVSERTIQTPPAPPRTRPQGLNYLSPVSSKDSAHSPLTFLPGLLRPLALGLFILSLLAYLICLIFTAIWSRVNTGLTTYNDIGDGKYFLFQYLPTMIGMVLLIWLLQIEFAVYRVAPFIAMGPHSSPPSRLAGARLPLQPRSVVLPYFGHFGAKLPLVGIFVFIAWLQIFTIPLLGSSFNVYQNSDGVWSWIATQGAIWTVIILYILLILASIVLLIWLRRTETNLKWDPKSLADLMVLLEQSNALDGEGETVPQIGLWRTSHRPNEIFHGYAITDKPARVYEVHEGRIQEKRFSNPHADLEAGQPPRQSKEAFLPRDNADKVKTGGALPWFLKPFFALLWPIIAFVLVLAFLIVSYLPSTRVSDGFDPMVPAAVDRLGFSGTNFLYSILPTFLATIVFLGWMDIDLAYRYLTPFQSLTSTAHRTSNEITGDIAERTILPSYTADLPIVASLAAAFNTHYRLAFISFITLLTAVLPILASGIFWAQFSIPLQRVRIFAHMPAYHALTVFLVIHAFAYLATFPPATLRHAAQQLPTTLNSFAGVRDCVYQSRLLDDFAFRNPTSRTDLVTRLLSSSPAAASSPASRHLPANPAAAPVLGPTTYAYSAVASGGPSPDANRSRVSLADSIRGLGRARAQAAVAPALHEASSNFLSGPGRYAFSTFPGRDGTQVTGIDRIRA
jgi:hypothetical protein